MTVPVREFTSEDIHDLARHYGRVQKRVNPSPSAFVRRDLVKVRSNGSRDVLNVRSETPEELPLPVENKPAIFPVFVPEDEPRIPVSREVMKAVCARFKLTRAELIGGGRGAYVTIPRQVAMYLMVRECGLSKKEVGRRLGGRDHTTVIHGVRQISSKIQVDIETRALVEELTQQLKSGRWIIVTDLAA